MNLASEDTMPRFDYKCESPECGYVSHNLYVPTSGVDTVPACPSCGFDMEKLPSAPNFVIRGFSAKSGYSRKD